MIDAKNDSTKAIETALDMAERYHHSLETKPQTPDEIAFHKGKISAYLNLAYVLMGNNLPEGVAFDNEGELIIIGSFNRIKMTPYLPEYLGDEEAMVARQETLTIGLNWAGGFSLAGENGYNVRHYLSLEALLSAEEEQFGKHEYVIDEQARKVIAEQGYSLDDFETDGVVNSKTGKQWILNFPF